MKLWPFARETRSVAADSYSARIEQAHYSGATNPDAIGASATVALELGAGLWERCFSAAEVVDGPDVLTPGMLGAIGREMVRGGESVWQIVVDGTGLHLLPVVNMDVEGSAMPSSWMYRITLNGPSGNNTTRRVPASSVVHCMFSYDSTRPWRGRSPLSYASLSATVLARLEQSLSSEANTPTLKTLPLAGVTPEERDRVQKAVAAARQPGNGGTVIAVDDPADMRSRGEARIKADWNTTAIQPAPDQNTVEAHRLAGYGVLLALGVPAPLFDPRAAAGAKEGLRQFLRVAVAPKARVVEAELRTKLDAPRLRLDFSQLFAADITANSAALGQIVKAMMVAKENDIDITEAARLVGFMFGDTDGQT